MDVFNAVFHKQSGKFIYAKVSSEGNHNQIKEALELLQKAGLVISVVHTAANGIPLGAEVNTKKQKMLIFDTGICQRLFGLKMSDIILADDFDVINKGAIAESFVGLELLKYSSCYALKQLYYWHRENPNSNAELDYLIDRDQTIFPVEVKSGSKGSMQSLYLFLKEKGLEKGIRISLENFDSYDKVDVYPLYAVDKLE